MFRAGAALAARIDLAAVAYEPADATDIFVVDLLDLIDTERADLAPRPTEAGWAAVAAA